jgi:3-oxoacyl-[acyl-carrier-protein] synthase-3
MGKNDQRFVRPVKVAALATYVPPQVMTNADLEKLVDTNDEWIRQRTGVVERHVADPGVGTSALAVPAARQAVAQAGLTPDDIDLIVVGTTTPDTVFPSTACLVQHQIGASNAWGFDLGAACSGFTYALTTAAELVSTGSHRHALAIGADVMTSILDYQDRTTCVLFGDGAGAAVVSPANEDEPAIIDFSHEIDGSGGPALCLPAGGSLRPASHETVDQRLHFIRQDGQAVFKFAVRKTTEICKRILEKNEIGVDQLDLFVSHQANKRIIMSAAERLGLDEKKVVVNIERYGNTTGATIPLALADSIADGRLNKGDLVLLASVGAGFTVGSVLLRWAF